MHAYLITGGTTKARLAEIEKRLAETKVSPFDSTYLRLLPEEEHIGIDAVRAFKKQLLLAPQQSAFTAGVIENAHALTIEAQNALLKLLEEPPSHLIILSETENQLLLLPTIVSRCEVAYLAHSLDEAGATQDETQTFLLSLLAASKGQKLTRLDACIKDRSHAKNWTLRAMKAAHQLLLKAYTADHTAEHRVKITKLTRLCTEAYKELAANVNPRLVLDRVFLAL